MHLLGGETMLQTVEMRYKGIEKIKQTLAGNDIDFDDCGGYECITRGITDLSRLQEMLPALNNLLQTIAGNRQAFAWCNHRLKEFGLTGFDALIENKAEAALHSGKLVYNLTRLVQSMGVDILTGVSIKHWSHINSHVEVDCSYTFVEGNVQHISLLAGQLILCTNAFTSAIAPQHKVAPGRGQVIVTSEIPGLSLKGTFHYDEGFYYFRNLGNRILLGGGRNKAFDEETTGSFDESDIIQDELERFLSQHIASRYDYTIDYRWSGIMGFTDNRQPCIKKLEKNVYAVTSCNGMGVALTPVMAERLVTQLQEN